jgi:hypothetical protein
VLSEVRTVRVGIDNLRAKVKGLLEGLEAWLGVRRRRADRGRAFRMAMSHMGQKPKNSRRAYVFCFAAKNGHRQLGGKNGP